VGPAIPARKYVDGCQFGEESTSYARRIGLRLCRKSRLNGSERKAGVAQEDDAARVIGPQRIYRSPGGQLARRLANRFAPALDRLPAASLSGPASARARLRGSWFWRNHSKSLGRSFQAVHRVTRDSTLRTRRHRTGRMSPGCVRIPPDPRRRSVRFANQTVRDSRLIASASRSALARSVPAAVVGWRRWFDTGRP
jgi:hypothetical protein